MRSTPATVGEVGGSVPDRLPARHGGLRGVLGEGAWGRLPPAVRQRFIEPAVAVNYVGTFEVVRANGFGRVLAQLCRLLGTPVVPRTGRDVAAVVRVGPRAAGVDWNREYRWPGQGWLVRSTKVIDAAGQLIERLPARLCMPLAVYERHGILHFVSSGYYFDVGWGFDLASGRKTRWRIPLPAWLSPGTTHVQHIDTADGWFRFTMRVVHPWFGELFYQTGRFRAAEEST